MSRAKRWCFTIFGVEKDEFKEKIVEDEYLKGICAEETCPNTGRKHLQGFMYFKKRQRFSVIRLMFEKWHIEVAKGSDDENYKYCTKEDGDPYIWGDWRVAGQGCRVGEDIVEMLDDGEPICVVMRTHTDVWMKNFRAIDRMQELIEKEKSKSRKFREVEVIVIFGACGVGKTRYVVEKEDDLYICDMVDDGWWDGYENEEAILFDDFYGGVKYSKMLRYLDGYNMRLNVKGKSCQANWKRVYITSNEPPEMWYHGMNQETKALLRRIDQRIDLGRGDPGTEVAGNTGAATFNLRDFCDANQGTTTS